MRALITVLLAALFSVSAMVPASAHGPKGDGAESSQTAAPSAGETHAQPAPQVLNSPSEVEQEPQHRLLTLLENLHPATVHFPIGLLLFAGLAELVSWRRRSEAWRNASEITAAVGGIAAAIAALFGWVHTGMWVGGGADMQLHRWIGSGLGVLGLAIVWLALRRGEPRGSFRFLLALACLAIPAQAYLGAELGHGAGHLFK